MVMTDESWKPVPGYEAKYQVSDLGRVRSINHWDGRRTVRGKTLAPGKSASGHMSVAIGRRNTKQVHALVMLAFVGPKPQGLEVLHLNHTPSDNRLCNLKYGTRSENLRMDYLAGVRRLVPVVGVDHPNAKLSNADIKTIRSSSLSQAELGRIFGVCYQTIGAIQKKQTWKHVL